MPLTCREYDLVLVHCFVTLTQSTLSLQFFRPLEIADIRIGIDRDGRPTGLARVEFYSHNDAVEAMKRDRMTLGESVLCP